MKPYYTIDLKDLPNREIEITGEISAEYMTGLRQKALKKMVEKVELDGFRKGTAPENLVAQKVGDLALLEESAEIALGEIWPEILKEKELDAIGQPSISITKIGIGSPLGFVIKTALSPDVKLGKYKEIAKNIKKPKIENVDEKDVEEVILHLRREIAHTDLHKNKDDHEHNHPPITDDDLPEVNEDFIKKLGNFSSVEDLNIKIKENLTKEKEQKSKDSYRSNIIEAIVTGSTVEIPLLITESETDRMLVQFKEDVARAGLTFEDYLKHIKKTEKEIRDEWKEPAEKRAKSQIIISRIAQEENIKPSEEDIKREMEVILARDKNLDRFRVRMFVDNFLTNELVLKFLEGQSE